jgi:hypothetical protein
MSSPRRLATAALAALLLANLTAALAGLLPFGAGSRLQAAEIYVLTGNQSGSGNQAVGFGKIDSTTGNYTEIIANVGSGNQVSNLAWNVAASNFFVTENIHTDQNLRTLDTFGVLSASIGTIGRSLYGMAYNGTNTLYGYDYETDTLGSIDPSTGAWTYIGFTNTSSSSPLGGRLAFVNGSVYGAIYSDDGLFGSFSTVNGAFNEIASDSAFESMALAWDDTTMYGVFGSPSRGQKLYTISNTGSVTQIATISGVGLGTRFYGAAIASVPDPVPEIDPAGMGSVLALVTGALGLLERRRLKAKLA